ncbi:hypothetical protein F2P79_003841 [Pimephales promelas]|nr:hypothetical protein F2P79_003841 [Pimephales promelas]
MEEFMLLELKTFSTLYHISESNASPSNSLFTSSPPGMAYLLTQSTGRMNFGVCVTILACQTSIISLLERYFPHKERETPRANRPSFSGLQIECHADSRKTSHLVPNGLIRSMAPC